MTLTKVRLSWKRERGSLRPLTEKEIQKKLYGTYQGTGMTEERLDLGSLGPTQAEKVSAPLPRMKPSFSPDWTKISSVVFIGLKVFGSALRITASRIGTKWGVGVLATTLLFLGVHALNVYRTAAMKSPKASVVQKKITQPAPPPPVQRGATQQPSAPKEEKIIPSILPVPPVMRVIKDPATPLPPEKSYVVQICTYANEKDARRLVNQIAGARFPTFLHSIHRPNGKIFYLVLLGRFQTFSEAQTKLKEFRGKPIARDFPDSFVRTL